MFKGKQAKSSLSSNLCVKLISQKSKKVKLYQLPRHRQQTSKHSCGEGRSTQLRITSTLEGNTYFYSGEKYLLLLWRKLLTSTLERNTSCQKGRDLLINTHNCQPWCKMLHWMIPGLSQIVVLWPPDLLFRDTVDLREIYFRKQKSLAIFHYMATEYMVSNSCSFCRVQLMHCQT